MSGRPDERLFASARRSELNDIGNATAWQTQSDWEALSPEAALAGLQSTPAGLDDAEAAARLAKAGPNQLPAAHRRSGWLRFADQFRNVLIYVLIAASIITAAIGHWLDTAVIMALVIANAIIGWAQENRAEQALAAVGRLLAATASVIRGGAKRSIAAADLVPGDVVFVELGGKVPADLRLIEARSLSADEAMLTGESVPVQKSTLPVLSELALADRTSMLFSGTIVAAGQGRGVVVATGPNSELGKVGRMVGEVEQLETPLLQRLSRTGRILTYVILACAAVTMGIGYLIGALPLDDLFLAAVGFAVSAIPEGLPAVVTIILAIGVRRMAAHGALIRRLPAVETLGSVTVICTDKTGTLTHNELTARAIVTADHRYAVEGEGYAPDGRVVGEDGAAATATSDPVLAELVGAGILCNDARLRKPGDQWIVEGDPVEGALLALGTRLGVDAAALAAAAPRQDVLPFESDHRYMATLHRSADAFSVEVKGAPEAIFALCKQERTEQGERPFDQAGWQERVDAMASQGLRVLAFATGRRDDLTRLDQSNMGEDLIFLGLVGFIDPPRADAAAAMAECRSAGIQVKMISGDHAATALAVAREVGLDVSAGALTGSELARLEGDALIEAAMRVNVFARVDPAQKLRLVEALQAAGNSVAMTGDGVNDAPALRRADIGIAMGKRGSDAAREASEMVLVDDRFATIAAAVRQGRAVEDTLRKTLGYILQTNAGEALLLVGAILIGATLPITAIQILWINFATEVTLSLSIAFEPQARGVMARKPRPRGSSLINRHSMFRLGYIGVIMAAIAWGLFDYVLAQDRSLEAARAMAVNVVVAAEIAYLLVVASFRFRRDGSEPDNKAEVNWVALGMIGVVVVMELVATQWPAMASALGMAPLGLADWGLVVASGVAIWILGQLERRVSRRLFPQLDAADG